MESQSVPVVASAAVPSIVGSDQASAEARRAGLYGGSTVPPSFDAWVAARAPGFARFAYLVTGDRARAEEALQDALAKVYASWPRVWRADDPEAYVRRMVVNADVSAWRRFRRRETPVAVLPATGAVARDVAHTVTEEDAMWRLCLTLPGRQRAAVVLRFYEDLPDAKIASILGCTESTVRSQIHRALTTLRQSLMTEGGGSSD